MSIMSIEGKAFFSLDKFQFMTSKNLTIHWSNAGNITLMMPGYKSVLHVYSTCSWTYLT